MAGQASRQDLQFPCLPGVAPTCCRSLCAFCSAASASAAKALASADSLAAPLKSYRENGSIEGCRQGFCIGLKLMHCQPHAPTT